MYQVRVLIIDDSAFMRKVLTDILKSDPRIKVVGTARDGRDGLNKIYKWKPHVVTMDVNMPVLDGISALEEIMREQPLPVIMLSNELEDGAKSTLKAMENGAIDFIMKPSGEISLDIHTKRQEIISKVIAAKVAKLPALSQKESTPQGKDSKLTTQKLKNNKSMVAIGTSTGGPKALQRILTDLPKSFHTPILIVQHMPPVFTKSLADRLNRLCHLRVKEAVHGELIQRETVYIAPGDYHMTVTNVGNSYAIKLSKTTPINNHRPSVDILFNSVAKLNNINKIAVILTGMGSDGATGIKNIKKKDKDAIVLTESASTSVIYGMPKAAFETGLVNKVLPVEYIGHFLGTIFQHNKA
jgi:two-component system chemotaxis response regulator CheB